MYESDNGTIYTARDLLLGVAADFQNDYLTVNHYAECNGLYLEQAQKLIALARSVRDSQPPEA